MLLAVYSPFPDKGGLKVVIIGKRCITIIMINRQKDNNNTIYKTHKN